MAQLTRCFSMFSNLTNLELIVGVYSLKNRQFTKMAEGFKSSLPPLLLDLTADRYAAFKSWKTKWQDCVLLSGLKDKNEEFSVSHDVLHMFSAETRNIYDF